jgi:hypothetical protein
VKGPRAPRLDPRREPDFTAELFARAKAWIPAWGLADGERDFGRALLQVAARFGSEVAERLDGAGEKMRRGFLDWLAVRGEAARPARVPVAFKLVDAARDAVLAAAPVRMQVDAGGASVTFETETDVRLLPGRLQVVVGVDAEADAVYLPPPGLADLEPLEPLPVQWQLKSFAAAGAKKLQVDPEAGLVPETVVEAGGLQYRLTEVEKEIVTVDPPLTVEAAAGTILRKVTAFAPFDGTARNRQEHALYLGHDELLDVEAAATIAVVGAQALREGVAWQYWGKVDPRDEVGWQKLTLAPLDAQQPDAVVLTKPKGAVVPRAIAGKNSRWIRGVTPTIPPGQPPFRPTELAIRINCRPQPAKCPPDAAGQGGAPAAEGFANTTPLVLENVFFPLGKQPRQFDAFYLGSKEAFSKSGADVQLCFEVADPTFASLSAVREGWFADRVLAGVGRDRSLHLLQFDPASGDVARFPDREPLQPPPGEGGGAGPVLLDQRPWAVPVWTEGIGFLVATVAGADVWVWHERWPDRSNSGWVTAGRVPSNAATPGAVDGLVFLGDAVAPLLAALRDGELWLRDWPNGTQWRPVVLTGGPAKLKAIAPVLVDNGFGQLVSRVNEGLVGIGDDEKLYEVSTAVGTVGACTLRIGSHQLDSEIQPAALRTPGVLTAIAASTGTTISPVELVVRRNAVPHNLALALGETVAGPLTLVPHGGQVHFLAAVAAPTAGFLLSWAPFQPNGTAFRSAVPPAVGVIAGGPTAVGGYVAIPGTRADVLVAALDLDDRFAGNATIEDGIVLPATTANSSLVPNDVVTRMSAGLPQERLITGYGTVADGEVFYPIAAAFNGASGPLLAYKATVPLIGQQGSNPDELVLQAGDHEVTIGSWLLVNGTFYEVLALDQTSDPWIATLDQMLGADPQSYSRPLPTGGRAAPFMTLDPATNGNWKAALLAHRPLLFPGAAPEQQQAKAFSTDVFGRPIVVALAAEFATAPGVNPTFIVDAAVGEWTRKLGDTTSNPELSWEYWNGTGWWKLQVGDQTLHLKASGAVRFTVPDDAAATDWAGRTNHWIRARLVGGDYGSELVTVTTTPTGNTGETQQTIERSTAGIRAPSVVRLHISYRVCRGMLPDFVLAQDSGSVRDQSDANRTPGATVEALVPLAVSLGRLSAPVATAPGSEPCPLPCACPPAAGAAAAVPAPTRVSVPRLFTGRALFVGFAAELSGAPVNVLLLAAEERPHEALAPMKIEALAADGFVPVVAEDSTRALGESGLLSMSFPVGPTPRELFGMENLTWLRLTPASGPQASEWRPTLRGAYLNAVWASAQETLTRELLGASQGEPNLSVRLARPPVLRGTLELRVREPLGDEERAALRAVDETRVRSDVDGLPGDWVLWKQVLDAGDESPEARVYALDETSGEVRFGDGRHGMIPPIGRDAIVAFTYKRTEVGKAGEPGSTEAQDGDDAPANAVGPRTELNLVSPVESVEAVFAADQAAGGAPPETDERVLRFGTARLRHRNRAVTAADFEDLALQSSPDVVQARCFVGGGGVEVVVVMRGADPRPSAAEARALRGLLLAAAPAVLAAPRALRVTGPRVRRLRVVLRLRVVSLDHAGAVARDVEKQVAALFDSAGGGRDGCGWALGREPSEEEVARALVDVQRLEGLGEVTLNEVLPDGAEQPWSGPGGGRPVRRDELVVLDEDAVRLGHEVVEVVA